MLLSFYIISSLAFLVSIMLSVLLFFVGRKLMNTAFRFQRLVFLFLYFFVAAYLLMILFYSEFQNGRFEVLSIGSLLMIYFLFETYFFSFTALFHADYHRQKPYWIMFNAHVLVIVLLSLWYMSVGEIHSYFSLSEFVHTASRTDLRFSTRIYVFLILLVNIIYMMYLLIQVYRRYSLVINELNISTYDNHEKRMGAYLVFWGLGIFILFIGQFSNSVFFHIVLKALLLVLMIITFIGHMQFRRAIIKYDIVDKKMKYKELDHAIGEWLAQEPYPLLKSNITMDDVVDDLDVPREVFSHYLTDELGISFSAWLAEKRISRCENLLMNTDLTLSELAYECGYADLPTMSKAFKRKYGFPPSKFRKYKDAKKIMQMHENK